MWHLHPEAGDRRLKIQNLPSAICNFKSATPAQPVRANLQSVILNLRSRRDRCLGQSAICDLKYAILVRPGPRPVRFPPRGGN